MKPSEIFWNFREYMGVDKYIAEAKEKESQLQRIKDLCVLLNVSQGQIFRHYDTGTNPTKDELDCWCRVMRVAEMFLRKG